MINLNTFEKTISTPITDSIIYHKLNDYKSGVIPNRGNNCLVSLIDNLIRIDTGELFIQGRSVAITDPIYLQPKNILYNSSIVCIFNPDIQNDYAGTPGEEGFVFINNQISFELVEDITSLTTPYLEIAKLNLGIVTNLNSPLNIFWFSNTNGNLLNNINNRRIGIEYRNNVITENLNWFNEEGWPSHTAYYYNIENDSLIGNIPSWGQFSEFRGVLTIKGNYATLAIRETVLKNSAPYMENDDQQILVFPLLTSNDPNNYRFVNDEDVEFRFCNSNDRSRTTSFFLKAGSGNAGRLKLTSTGQSSIVSKVTYFYGCVTFPVTKVYR